MKDIGSKPFIRTMRLRNFLSFGNSSDEIEMKSLNVFIGPNGSGKSNLIESLGILKAAPTDLREPIQQGGGIGEWLWKGGKGTSVAEIDITASNPKWSIPLRHRISFSMSGQRFELVDEVIENERPDSSEFDKPRFFYHYQSGHPILSVRTVVLDAGEDGRGRVERNLSREEIEVDHSVLSQRKDPDQYPEITYLGEHYKKIKLYQEWDLGRDTPPRRPQQADLPGDFLREDAGNLSLVLNNLENSYSNEWKTIMEKLRGFSDSFEKLTTNIIGGTVQVFMHEKGLNQPIPATRLSDGTLRYLCLLTLLCHPEPPPVLCIEEPELGLHPDIIPTIAELLVDASHRTQLFVTTHSDVLVDALSETPEAIIVCEKDGGATTMRRLGKEELSDWLEKYSLGQLWLDGKVGGTRW